MKKILLKGRKNIFILTVAAVMFYFSPETAICAGKKILTVCYDTNPEYAAVIKSFSEGVKKEFPSAEIITLIDGKNRDKDAFIAELRQMAVDADLVFTVGTTTALLVKHSGLKKPVLFSAVVNPKKIGLVNRYRKPGGNFTGSYCRISIVRQLHFIQDTLPAARRIGILYDPQEISQLLRAEDWARGVSLVPGLTLIKHPFSQTDYKGESLAALINGMAGNVDVFVIIIDPAVNHYGKDVVRLANENNIPTYVSGEYFMLREALLGMGFDFERQAREVNVPQAVRILNGETPAAIPVGIRIEYSVVVNKNTARKIGVVLPEHVIESATMVIE